MMEFVHVAVAVLGLLSLGHSAPVTSCENLIQPREIHGNQLVGKWTQIAVSLAIPGFNMLTKTVEKVVETAWMNITAANEANTFDILYVQKTRDMCFTLKANMTLVNNSMVHNYQYPTVLLNTGCPDCLVMYSNNTIGRTTFKALHLLSRRVKVSAAELEEFTKQTECLNLESPAILDSEKGFCPDPALAPGTKTTDLSLSNIMPDDLNLSEKLFTE
ncbi:neural Wiskott-Aldrich syndrome protein [Sarotherodon galilaeus]